MQKTNFSTEPTTRRGNAWPWEHRRRCDNVRGQRQRLRQRETAAWRPVSSTANPIAA